MSIEFINAAQFGDLEKVRALLAQPGINIDDKDQFGFTALMNAISNNHPEVVDYLIEKGADVNIGSGYSCGHTALMEAAKLGRHNVVEALLAAGAEVNGEARDGYTALMSAAENAHLPAPEGAYLNVVKALLAAGAEVNATSKGYTALMLATLGGHHHVVNALLSEERVERDYSALLEVCESRQHLDCIDVVKRHQRDDLLVCLEKQVTKMSDVQKALYGLNKELLEEHCKCPVSLAIMVNPVIMFPGGHSMDLEEYKLLPNPKVNPLTNLEIRGCEENRALKGMIDGCWEKLQTLADELASSVSLQSVGVFAGQSDSEPATKRQCR